MDNKPESSIDIEKIALNILKDSRTYGIFPTPVDRIINYCELKINQNIDLSTIEPSFISKAFGLFVKAKRKVLGILDYFKNEILIDSTQNKNRNRFIKLHETGHKVIPWQEQVHRFDDKYSLDQETKLLFESEANYFASSTLFQLNIFNEESKKLPLTIESPMLLAKRFGSSTHASLRRYVEYSYKKCALLVFEKNFEEKQNKIKLRNYFQSQSFTLEFGNLQWPSTISINFPFMIDIYYGKKYNINGVFSRNLETIGLREFHYHYFNNSYNMFVFFFPKGETNKSRTKIHLTALK